MSLFFKGMTTDAQKCVKTETPFDLSLNDCLACSGCITDHEPGLLSVDLSFVDNPTVKTSFVISPQSKVNLFNIYGAGRMSYRTFETLLSIFLKDKFNVFKIVDTSYMRSKIYEETYKEYLGEKHLIISSCPGTVMYIEKTAPHLIKYLSRVKSPQQMAFSLVKGSRTVSVMPCYDKKLENGRDGVQFDYVLTTIDFYKVLNDLGFDILVRIYNKDLLNESGSGLKHEERMGDATEKTNMEEGLGMDPWERTQWNIGSSSGGYTEFIAKKSPKCVVTKVKKGIEEYEVFENEVISQITGLENSINYFKSSKVRGPVYKMTEIFLCQNSCIGGPGQLRTNKIETDIEAYKECGKEQPTVFYLEADLDEKREFNEEKVKKINFKVEW